MKKIISILAITAFTFCFAQEAQKKNPVVQEKKKKNAKWMARKPQKHAT